MGSASNSKPVRKRSPSKSKAATPRYKAGQRVKATDSSWSHWYTAGWKGYIISHLGTKGNHEQYEVHFYDHGLKKITDEHFELRKEGEAPSSQTPRVRPVSGTSGAQGLKSTVKRQAPPQRSPPSATRASPVTQSSADTAETICETLVAL